jgi:hypothetical protein
MDHPGRRLGQALRLRNDQADLEPATYGLKERILIGVLASSSIGKSCREHHFAIRGYSLIIG